MDSIYFEDPLGLLIELASYRFEPPVGFTHAEVLLEAHKLRESPERLQHRRDPSRRCHRGARQAIARVALGRPIAEGPVQLEIGGAMANQLSILRPSVNNLTVRIFVRAAGLEFEEDGHVGQEGHARVPRQGPRRPDAAARGGGPAQGLALGELRDHAVPLQQARPRPVLSHGPGRAGHDRQRDVLPDRHLLPAARARHLPGPRLRPVPRRGRDLGCRRRA